MYRSGITYPEAVCEFKKKFILTVLQDANGNQCKAARLLGMHRKSLSRNIADLKLDTRALRNGGRRPPRSGTRCLLRGKCCARRRFVSPLHVLPSSHAGRNAGLSSRPRAAKNFQRQTSVRRRAAQKEREPPFGAPCIVVAVLAITCAVGGPPAPPRAACRSCPAKCRRSWSS